MIQFTNIKQFNCPIERNSIVQFEAIQLSNCSNSIVQLMKNTFIHSGNTKSSSH